MKKWLVWTLLAALLWAAGNCIETARTLQRLQNEIVERSFVSLRKGAWARYEGDIRALYVGERSEGGQRLYGIEVATPKTAAQIWYAVVEKRKSYKERDVRFKTLDAREIYLPMGTGGLVRIGKEQITLYERMLGEDASTILTFARILMPPDCTKVPALETVDYPFRNGRRVRAVKITAPETGGFVVVSPEVPFGLVESNDGSAPTLRMTDFAEEGAKPTITGAMRERAMPMPVMPLFPGARR